MVLCKMYIAQRKDKEEDAPKDLTMTTLIPHKNILNLCETVKPRYQATTKMPKYVSELANKELRVKRHELILKQANARKKKDSMYMTKMKKMIKKVSTIIYHHIVHSHKHIPKASQGALLFSEQLIMQKKEQK